MSCLPRPVLRIGTRQDALRLFAPLDRSAVEAVGIAYLGPDRSLLGLRHAMGRADSAAVPVTRIVRDALALSARSLLIAHNHPDGDPRPSAADLALTRRLAQGLAMLDMVVLDHLILAPGGTVSLRDMGMM